MIHSTKEYWFAFEPYIHIALKQDEALLYNTLDRECIRVTDGELLDLLTAIVDKQNCGVIKITKEDLERPVTFNFLKTVRDKFFGDLYDCELSDRKPIQLYPVLNLQEEVTRLQRFDSGFVGTNMFTYLYQVKVDFNHLDEHESCRLADKVWSEVVCSEVKLLLFVVHDWTTAGFASVEP